MIKKFSVLNIWLVTFVCPLLNFVFVALCTILFLLQKNKKRWTSISKVLFSKVNSILTLTNCLKLNHS